MGGWPGRTSHIRERSEYFFFCEMHSPRGRRSPKALAQHGHAEPGDCRARTDEEKDGCAHGNLRGTRSSDVQLYVARQLLDYVSLNVAPCRRLMKDLIEEVERWDLERKPASLRWTNTFAHAVMEDVVISTRDSTEYLMNCFQDSWKHVRSIRKDARLPGREDARCKQGPGGEV